MRIDFITFCVCLTIAQTSFGAVIPKPGSQVLNQPSQKTPLSAKDTKIGETFNHDESDDEINSDGDPDGPSLDELPETRTSDASINLISMGSVKSAPGDAKLENDLDENDDRPEQASSEENEETEGQKDGDEDDETNVGTVAPKSSSVAPSVRAKLVTGMTSEKNVSANQTSSSETSGTRSISTAVIVCAVLGSVFVIAVIAGGVYYWRSNSKSAAAKEADQSGREFDEVPIPMDDEYDDDDYIEHPERRDRIFSLVQTPEQDVITFQHPVNDHVPETDPWNK